MRHIEEVFEPARGERVDLTEGLTIESVGTLPLQVLDETANAIVVNRAILFGAWINRGTLKDVGEAAQLLYRKRRILERLHAQVEGTNTVIKDIVIIRMEANPKPRKWLFSFYTVRNASSSSIHAWVLA